MYDTAGCNRQSNRVVAERPAEILADDSQRAPRHRKTVNEGSETRAEQHNICAGLGQSRAVAHRNRYVGACQYGRIIDAVTNNRHGFAVSLVLANQFEFLRRGLAVMKRGHAELLGEPGHGSGAIAAGDFQLET